MSERPLNCWQLGLVRGWANQFVDVCQGRQGNRSFGCDTHHQARIWQARFEDRECDPRQNVIVFYYNGWRFSWASKLRVGGRVRKDNVGDVHEQRICRWRDSWSCEAHNQKIDFERIVIPREAYRSWASQLHWSVDWRSRLPLITTTKDLRNCGAGAEAKLANKDWEWADERLYAYAFRRFGANLWPACSEPRSKTNPFRQLSAAHAGTHKYPF